MTDEPLEKIRARSEELSKGAQDPAGVANELLSLAADLGSEDPSSPLWGSLVLLWGELTDRWDLRIDGREAVEALMVSAASDWLDAADEDADQEHFFDRWLYGKLGYTRVPDSELYRRRAAGAEHAHLLAQFNRCRCDELRRIPRAGAGIYSGHLVWLDVRSGRSIYRCPETARLWSQGPSGLERATGGRTARTF